MSEVKFEKLMSDLAKSVSLLENGQLQLEQAMEEYKKGIEIINILNKKLENAKKQMKVIKIDE